MTCCKRCIMDDSIPGVVFDDVGVCNYCKMHDEMDRLYPVHGDGLGDLVRRIKKDGASKEYDAVVGVSGGCDSSYLSCLMHDYGVRLLGVHMDNGWNTPTSKKNMSVIANYLGIPVEVVKVDQRVFDSLCRSFLLAGTPDADIPNDLALLEVIQQSALDHGVRWVLNGHSFRTEGSAPLGWTYMDGGYLEDVNRRYENIDISGFPHLSWDKQMVFFNSGLHNVRPIYYVDYNKAAVINHLQGIGWEWYQGLHAENIYTKFVGRYLWPRKFGIDYRVVEYSALIRSGQLSRLGAVERLVENPGLESYYLASIKKRLGLSDAVFDEIIFSPARSYQEYDNYLPQFRDPRNGLFFKRLLDEDKISLTFYKKYIEGV